MAGRTGKAVFDQRVEYPLPRPTATTKDYVFNFVGSGDASGYGKNADRFFAKFYKGHVRRSVSSLEQMADVLAAEVAGGVTRIRELVLVSHGAPQGLLTKVTNTVPMGTPMLGEVTFRSLALLQRRFAANDPAFAAFKSDRAQVVARLLDDSWVTVRACRVGQGDDVMYALFSFFGGRANVYAPREYQFFGDCPIAPGMRVETRAKMHAHLVRQRFYPLDQHTPERRDAIVDATLDPGLFGDPFDLASTRLDDTTSAQAITYQDFVTSLNRSRISAPLRTEFGTHGHDLSARTEVRVSVRDGRWIVNDPVRHAGINAIVKYDVGEVFEPVPGGQQAILRAWAALAETDVVNDSFPLQLFFYDSENGMYKGKVQTLESYIEEPGSAAAQARFDDLVATLPTPAGSTTVSPLLRTTIQERSGVELTAAATIQSAGSEVRHGQTYRTWAIADQVPYLVKLEHPLATHNAQGHMISLYEDLRDNATRLKAENASMAYLGQDPDTPGTELAAYLDRATLDELLALLDHLRKPYRVEHSFYLHHALQAIKRKKEYAAWSIARIAGNTDPLGPLTDPYESLVGSEAEDKRKVVHEFDFNGIWQEVKVSHRHLGVVNVDLFAEEDLWTKFGAAGDPADAVAALGLEPDSPFNDRDEQRQAAVFAFELARVDKTAFEPVDVDIDCQEFAQILTKWKDLQGVGSDEIQRELGLLTASDGATFLDHVSWLYDKYKIAKMGPELFNIAFMRDGLAVKIVSRIPVIGVVSEIGTPTALTGLLSIAPAITIPFTLWMKTLEAQVEADKVWENTGKLTAIRQWLRLLILQTFRDDFPDNLSIDLGWHGSTEPHIERYFQEQRDENGVFFSFVWAPDRMKKGFDEGRALMDAKGLEEILDRADRAVDDILREIGVDSCKAKVLVDLGFLDLRAARGRFVRSIANDLLAKLPKV